ncbi:glycoside hydrolase family 2 TIM barrel-domain containing protein [Persicobacter diffluens]|uniref:Beta-galactosidase n=1 Tax=Persicobacter diffluens TaxID=981 RepID=A0AAN4VZV4_9BACT|nr:hypothetical protein PEDI_36480 [Persicobacter diffluens]
MKYFWLLLACWGLSGNLLAQTFDKHGQEEISLDGFWKFHTFLGDGSNYLDIHPQSGDIIIDNHQSDLVEISGNWKIDTEATRESECWGADYLSRWFTKGDTSSYVRYKTTQSKAGYYEYFIYYPFGHHLTAQIGIDTGDGPEFQYRSFRNLCNKWISLGVFQQEKEAPASLTVTAINPGGVVADAIMLRPVSEEVFLKEKEEKAAALQRAYQDTHWDELQVPGHWGMLNQYANYTGKGIYRKEVTLPDSWKKGDDYRIRFEGVYHVAKVYWNGKFVGEHRGGFTPFELDVSEAIDYDGRNVVVVEADNSVIIGATWNWGGIIREVKVLRNTPVRLHNQYVHVEPDLRTGEAKVKVKYRVENNGKKAQQLVLESDIRKGKSLRKLKKEFRIGAGEQNVFELTTSLKAKEVKLWHFDHPELYQIQTTIGSKDKNLHYKEEVFGIRKFEVKGQEMLLNGEPVRLSGFNRVSDHRYWGSSEPQELIDLDIKLMKDAGANFMRIMHGTQNKRLIEACDREGILLFEEVNVREIQNPEFQAPDYPLIKQWLTEMIERDINHPSIVGWSIGNELSGHYDYVKNMIPWVKKNLDPYRLVTCVSNTGYRKYDNRNNDPLAFSDIIMQNIYQKDPAKVMDSLHARWPEKVIFFSEFGVERFTTPDLDNDIPGIIPWYAYMQDQRPYTSGASIWTFNDYRSGYSQTLESENRAWGIVNAWRTKRRAYATYQQTNSPVKDILIEQVDIKKRTVQVTMPIRGREDFPSYAMKGYRMELVVHNASGKVISQTSKALPDLNPDQQEWTGMIKWPMHKEQAFDIRLRLISANGYTRFEKIKAFASPEQPVIRHFVTAANSARIYFENTYDAEEYFLRYEVDGIQQESSATIGNFIDVPLSKGTQVVELQLIARNNYGESIPSLKQTSTIGSGLLPPIVWEGFVRDNRLVVGYSGEKEDQFYVVRYGDSPDNLNRKMRSNTRGMMTIPWEKEAAVFFQIKRQTKEEESDWSEIWEANALQFDAGI